MILGNFTGQRQIEGIFAGRLPAYSTAAPSAYPFCCVAADGFAICSVGAPISVLTSQLSG